MLIPERQAIPYAGMVVAWCFTAATVEAQPVPGSAPITPGTNVVLSPEFR